MIFLLLFENLRCFNYLSNSVEQRRGIEISGIRPDIRYPVLKMAGYPVGRISGKTAIRSIPTVWTYPNFGVVYFGRTIYCISYVFLSLFFRIVDTFHFIPSLSVGRVDCLAYHQQQGTLLVPHTVQYVGGWLRFLLKCDLEIYALFGYYHRP